jgi:hypothetical protein
VAVRLAAAEPIDPRALRHTPARRFVTELRRARRWPGEGAADDRPMPSPEPDVTRDPVELTSVTSGTLRPRSPSRAVTPTRVGTVVAIVLLLAAAAVIAQTPLEAGNAVASPAPPAATGAAAMETPTPTGLPG